MPDGVPLPANPEPRPGRRGRGNDPSGGPHPFGLRFFIRKTRSAAVPAFGYCEDQQVTVDDDGRPVVQGPNASWSQTTTGNMDGNEETMMDQDPDSN